MLRHVPDLESRSLRWMELGTWQSRRDARSMLRLRVMIDYLLPRKDGQRASGFREARRQILVIGDAAVAFYKFGISRAEWKEFQYAIAASHADACALLPATVVLSLRQSTRPSLARTCTSPRTSKSLGMPRPDARERSSSSSNILLRDRVTVKLRRMSALVTSRLVFGEMHAPGAHRHNGTIFIQ